MQAITTKALGPTDTQGQRIIARCQAKRVTVAWDYALGTEANHDAACRQLVLAMGWDGPNYPGRWVGGGLPDGTGNAYVFVPGKV